MHAFLTFKQKKKVTISRMYNTANSWTAIHKINPPFDEDARETKKRASPDKTRISLTLKTFKPVRPVFILVINYFEEEREEREETMVLQHN